MTKYLLWRLLQFTLVILGATTVVFFAIYVAVDPVRVMLPIGTPEHVVESFRQELGLDRTLLAQFGTFLWGVVRLDFGESLWLGGDAMQHVLERLPATAKIVLWATLIGVTLGWALGMIASRWPNRAADRIVTSLGYLTISVPEFWVAIMLIWLFAVNLGWFPSAGYGTGWRHAALPIAVLCLRPLGRTAQMTRTSMAVEERRQYVLTAVAKGVPESRISLRHKLRNASMPITTIIFYDLGRLFVGTAVVVEAVFAWPGLGFLATNALQRGDLFLVQAAVFVAAVITAGLNLVADGLYFWLDPRTRATVRRR